jgi:hypothetical protein
LPALSPDHLLEQADRLMAAPRRGPPRQTDLRRVISNAYYAVFHAVVTAAADDFVGGTHRDTPRYELVYRGVDHASLRRLCEDVIKTTLPAKYTKYQPAGGFGPDLAALANAVVDLQEKRHRADYDPRFRAVQADVAFDISRARAALARFRVASRAQRQAFLSLLVFPPRHS